VPVRAMVSAGASLAMLSWPEKAPGAGGTKLTEKDEVWPGLSVSGKEGGVITKAAPESDTRWTVTADELLHDRVTVCVSGTPTAVFPNERAIVLTDREADEASATENVLFTEPSLAVRVTTTGAGTDAIVAVKEALDRSAAMVTAGGMITAALLLKRAICTPFEGAADDSVTVQESDIAPVADALVHEIAASDADERCVDWGALAAVDPQPLSKPTASETTSMQPVPGMRQKIDFRILSNEGGTCPDISTGPAMGATSLH